MWYSGLTSAMPFQVASHHGSMEPILDDRSAPSPHGGTLQSCWGWQENNKHPHEKAHRFRALSPVCSLFRSRARSLSLTECRVRFREIERGRWLGLTKEMVDEKYPGHLCLHAHYALSDTHIAYMVALVSASALPGTHLAYGGTADRYCRSIWGTSRLWAVRY